MHKFILADISCPDVSYGVMAGLQGRHWGGYLRIRSDFAKTPETLYECLSDGSLTHGGIICTSGNVRNSNLYVTGGALMQISLYAGAGYGRRTLSWQDIEGNWARVSDWSHKGLTIDAGMFLSWKYLAFSVGLSTLSFKTYTFSIGIGLRL